VGLIQKVGYGELRSDRRKKPNVNHNVSNTDTATTGTLRAGFSRR
jgi:hypothetical protein